MQVSNGNRRFSERLRNKENSKKIADLPVKQARKVNVQPKSVPIRRTIGKSIKADVPKNLKRKPLNDAKRRKATSKTAASVNPTPKNLKRKLPCPRKAHDAVKRKRTINKPTISVPTPSNITFSDLPDDVKVQIIAQLDRDTVKALVQYKAPSYRLRSSCSTFCNLVRKNLHLCRFLDEYDGCNMVMHNWEHTTMTLYGNCESVRLARPTSSAVSLAKGRHVFYCFVEKDVNLKRLAARTSKYPFLADKLVVDMGDDNDVESINKLIQVMAPKLLTINTTHCDVIYQLKNVQKLRIINPIVGVELSKIPMDMEELEMKFDELDEKNVNGLLKGWQSGKPMAKHVELSFLEITENANYDVLYKDINATIVHSAGQWWRRFKNSNGQNISFTIKPCSVNIFVESFSLF